MMNFTEANALPTSKIISIFLFNNLIILNLYFLFRYFLLPLSLL
jgi:hypothetical protein